MEHQLKARLIGATVLVLLAVLLIPELLSGRKATGEGAAAAETGRGTRTYVIDLGGAVASGARLEQPAKPLPTTSAAAQGTAPPPIEPTAAVETAESAPAPMPSQLRPAPLPNSSTPVQVAVAQPEKTASVSGRWAVQVGAFGSIASADKLIGELRRDGYAAFESPLSRGGKTLHRVRIGPEAERATADMLSGRLKARGLPATVVAND